MARVRQLIENPVEKLEDVPERYRFGAALDELYLSFDGSGKLGGVDFDDHDLLHFDFATWTKLSYPGLSQAGTAAADLDAADYATTGLFADGFETGDTDRWTL